MSIKNNTTSLQSLLEAVNALPEVSGSGGTDTSDATATADKIFLNETAYVNNEKVTGTFTIDSELNTQDDLIAQIQSALANKAGGVVLPELSNPATAENLEEGYELIDGDGNIVVGTHVCSGGGDGGNIMYFNVINNLPDTLCVNGKICFNGESTAIPYDEMNYENTLFFISYLSEEYSISAPYTQIWEDDDGQMIEEGMEGAPIYRLDEDFGCVIGYLADFYPDPYTVLNNTITFEAIY